MPLNPSTMSWEINPEEVTIIKIIGRGAFSEVAKATVRNCLRSGEENTTVAVKKLKGVDILICITANMFHHHHCHRRHHHCNWYHH